MAERPLLRIERALIAAAVEFCVIPATGVQHLGRGDLLRLMTICDAIERLPKEEAFEVTGGPVHLIYWSAYDLVKAHRDKTEASAHDRRNGSKYLAAHIFMYFQSSLVVALRDLGLPDNVLTPTETEVL